MTYKEAETYDIKINDSQLNQYGFTKFKLPLMNGKGNSSNSSTMMTLCHEDRARIIYCPFYNSDLDRSAKSLEQKLLSQEEWIDNDTAMGLVTLFRNECLILREEEDSVFFKDGNGKATSKKSNSKSRSQNQNKQQQQRKGQGQQQQVNGNNNNGCRAAAPVIREDSAQIALGLVEQECSELFLDQFGSPYAAVRIGEHTETLRLKSSRFKNWLCRIFYRSEQDILNNESVTNVLNILKARAEFDGTPRNLHLRVAKVPTEAHTIFCDLTNKEWLAVKITENGWTVEYAPIIFKRYSNQQPQVYPSKEYTQDIFDEFMQLINVKGEDNKLLLKCYIIALFYPDIPKPILMLHGEQGSAKSTLQELIKMLVDPSSIKTLTFPRDINELVQKLSHNYIAYFDNMSNIPEWISDQLCRAVTGSGFSKRELYSDDDDIIYNFKRCIGLNGINLAATKADLLDRGIIIELERITKDKIRKIEEIWQEFEKIKSQLLGYIFDILVKVLQIVKNGGISNEIKGLPRMADFAIISEIISRCMRYDNNRFLRAYDKNIELQTEEAIQAHPVGNAIVKFMEELELKTRKGIAIEENNSDYCNLLWKGTATELLSELDHIADQLKINTNYKLWPKSPNSLSRRLNEVKTNLREIGIIIDRSARDQKTNSKTIEIRKISLISLESLADKNHVQIISDIPNDTERQTNDISLGEGKISLDKIPQNHAQNSQPNDINDTNDILHTSQDFLYSCYHCDDFHTNSERDYERHVISNHQKGTADKDHPCYPTEADIERLGLKPQGKYWEFPHRLIREGW